jgi:hypothetical protein
MYLKKHLSKPAGSGRNFLSICCCNFRFVKFLAEPFLNTSRGVQDLVDNSIECIQLSRARFSCGEYLNAATDVEEGDTSQFSYHNLVYNNNNNNNSNNGNNIHDKLRYEDDEKKKARKFNTFYISSPMALFVARMVHNLTILFSIGLILLMIYSSFTV